MRLLGYKCKTTFWEDFSIAERFGAEAIKTLTRGLGRNGRKIELMEQNSQWYLIINAGIGTENRTKNLVNFMLNRGKNIMSRCWIIGKVKI